jgi:hypothetical protein
MNFEERRRRVDVLRRIPLGAVLQAVGAEPDRIDPAKWHTGQGVLSVNGVKFINWNQGRGGGGAIDLAMHLNACDFLTAIQWLAQYFHSLEPEPPAPQPTIQPDLRLPVPDAAKLVDIQRYLIEKRRLPDTFLRPLLHSGQIYADRHANAVFLLLEADGRAAGAELRGTTARLWRGLAPGSRKDFGYFSCGPVQASSAMLCESAIDALSCAVLHPGWRCISTAGARPNPAWLSHLQKHGYHLYCGFDADATGDQMAHAMISFYPAIQRLRPPLHDWNDVLTASA